MNVVNAADHVEYLNATGIINPIKRLFVYLCSIF